MKIVFLTHYSEMFGANKSLVNLLQGLQEKIEPVVLMPQAGSLTAELDKIQVDWKIAPLEYSVYTSNVWTEIKRPLRIIRRSLVNRKTVAFIRQLKPDLIYTNSSVLNCGVAAACKLGVPHYWHIREYGKEDYNLSQDLGDIGFRHYLNKSKRVITISKSIDDHVRKIAPECNSVQIYNGVIRKKDISPQPRTISGRKTLTLSIIGYMNESKGQDIAVSAMKKIASEYDKIQLLIVGDGDTDYVNTLRSDVSTSGLQDRITFTGYIKDMEETYNKTDILLMCSRKEAFGRVTIEAMARGIPVIGTNSGGTKELIEHGVNGLLFNRSVEELATCVKGLVNDASLYAEMSQNALTNSSRFTIEEYSNSIFKELSS